MYKLIANTIVIIGYSLYPIFFTDNKSIENNSFISPTMSYDPWLEYNSNKNEELLNQIFIRELESYRNNTNDNTTSPIQF